MGKSKDNLILYDSKTIQQRIHTVRGVQVMLDRDLAEFYHVKATRLREQVKRNSKRFPNDFMFQLTANEVESMVSQNAIPSKKHLGGTNHPLFDITTVINLSLIILNLIIILYLNFRAYNARKAEDRDYQIKFDLYKHLIINNIRNLLDHSWETRDLFIDTLNSPLRNEEKNRLIEENFDRIEKIQYKFYRQCLSLVRSYSNDSYNDFKKLSESFYNDVIELLSKISSREVINEKILLGEINDKLKTYENDIYRLIDEYKPKHELIKSKNIFSNIFRRKG